MALVVDRASLQRDDPATTIAADRDPVVCDNSAPGWFNEECWKRIRLDSLMPFGSSGIKDGVARTCRWREGLECTGHPPVQKTEDGGPTIPLPAAVDAAPFNVPVSMCAKSPNQRNFRADARSQRQKCIVARAAPGSACCCSPPQSSLTRESVGTTSPPPEESETASYSVQPQVAQVRDKTDTPTPPGRRLLNG